MGFIPVTVAVEGPADVPVAHRRLHEVGLETGAVYGRNGKKLLDESILGYNEGARLAPWFVLRDLNNDAPCPGALIAQRLPSPAPLMCYRIAVRETESWLLADRERAAAYLSVALSRLPANPEVVIDPKRELVKIARHSKRRAIRDDVVPEKGSTARVGPGYVARITEYVVNHWRPVVAASSSRSLSRRLSALRRLAHEG
jgi:hypothetical protein